MGTRGTIIFYYQGVYYSMYNHMDSYPQWLGVRLVKFLDSTLWKINLNHDMVYHLLYTFNLQLQVELQVEQDKKNFSLPMVFTDKVFPTLSPNIEWMYIYNCEEKTLKINGGYFEPTYILSELAENENWVKEFDTENDRLYELATTTTR